MSNPENIVRDIFGDSESESDGEFEGFDGNPNEEEKSSDKVNDEKAESDNDEESERNVEFQENNEQQDVVPEDSDSSDDDIDDDSRPNKSGIVYDFDVMLQKKKEQNSRKRRRKNVDIINDSDDIIAEMIYNMKEAAEKDFELNKIQKTAVHKLKMLPLVEAQLKKIDYRDSLLDSGVLNVITDWLTRLPNGSLPHLQIREALLKVLIDFNIEDVDLIKSSGIGKAVMYLFKHPKETRENKKLACKLVSSWSRPIFNNDSSSQLISKDDREQRDFDNMQKFKRQTDSRESASKHSKVDDKLLKPGDKGWIPRARVPAPSMKDYVVRPKSTIDIDMTRISTKKSVSRFERHMRNFKEMKKTSKLNRAVPISIEGRNMAL